MKLTKEQKIAIAAIITFLVILIGWAVFGSGLTPQDKSIVDCQQDDLCFADHIEICKPAKVLFTISDNLISEKRYEEISGLEGDKCAVYIKVVDQNILLEDAEKKTDLGKALMQIIGNVKEKDMICKFKVNLQDETLMTDIAETLKNLNPTTKTFQEGCSGTLKEAILTMAAQMQAIMQMYDETLGDVYSDYYDAETEDYGVN